LWNATAATGIPESEYAVYFDSVSVCFSKGLGAPVGSALAGKTVFIEAARRFRKQFGGGMRQAGIIAAAAIYALENNRERLSEDHENARKLAEGLSAIPGIVIDPTEVSTNMVYFDVEGISAEELVHRLKFNGVRILAISGSRIRAVTNLMVDSKDIDSVLKFTSDTMESIR
jgi:threonine aldolase